MLIRNWGAALASVGLVGLTTVGFVFFDRPHCYFDQHQCAVQPYLSSVNNNLSLHDIGVWARDNHDAIEALSALISLGFTVALVIFTAVLAQKTAGLFTETAGLRDAADQQRADFIRSVEAAEVSAQAAEKSAGIAEAALTTAERPYFLPMEPRLQIWRYGPPGSIPVEPPEYRWRVSYGVRNFRRTLGFLREITVELAFLDTLPGTPKYDDYRSLEGHIPVTAQVDQPYLCPDAGSKTNINRTTFSRIKNSELRAFFFGYIRYSDIFGYFHTEGFCFRFTNIGLEQEKSECTIVGGHQYNYTRSEKIPPEGISSIPPRGGELRQWRGLEA